MSPIASNSEHRAAPQLEPLVVSPREACVLLGCGLTRLYELIAARELDSFRDGSTRRITIASIKARIARKLTEPPAERHGRMPPKLRVKS